MKSSGSGAMPFVLNFCQTNIKFFFSTAARHTLITMPNFSGANGDDARDHHARAASELQVDLPLHRANLTHQHWLTAPATPRGRKLTNADRGVYEAVEAGLGVEMLKSAFAANDRIWFNATCTNNRFHLRGDSLLAPNNSLVLQEMDGRRFRVRTPHHALPATAVESRGQASHAPLRPKTTHRGAHGEDERARAR